MVRVRAVTFMFTMTPECLSYGLVFAEVWISYLRSGQKSEAGGNLNSGAGLGRIDSLWLLVTAAWIITSLVGLSKSSSFHSWTAKISLGGSMTLGFLFLLDQPWLILFLHSHPRAIAFPVAIVGLLLKHVFRSTILREVWRSALLVLFYPKPCSRLSPFQHAACQCFLLCPLR